MKGFIPTRRCGTLTNLWRERTGQLNDFQTACFFCCIHKTKTSKTSQSYLGSVWNTLEDNVSPNFRLLSTLLQLKSHTKNTAIKKLFHTAHWQWKERLYFCTLLVWRKTHHNKQDTAPRGLRGMTSPAGHGHAPRTQTAQLLTARPCSGTTAGSGTAGSEERNCITQKENINWEFW